MREDVVFGFVVVDHRWEDGLVIWRFSRRPRKREGTHFRVALIKARELEHRTVGSVAQMMIVSQSVVYRHQLLEEILMISADEDHLVALQQVEDKALQLDGLPASVEEVTKFGKILLF